MLDPARLVFIDETAVSTNMVRLRGRAPRGVRVIGAVPLGRWQTITFVAALRHNKMVAPMVVEGAMTGEMFLAYVENCLVPTLRRNDIVVMDNCRVHRGPALAGLSKQWARHCVTCRNIRPTSIPSRCLTANSRHSCVKWQREPSQALTAPSAPSSRSSVLKNVPTISACKLCFNMIEIRFRPQEQPSGASRSKAVGRITSSHLVDLAAVQNVAPGPLASAFECPRLGR